MGQADDAVQACDTYQHGGAEAGGRRILGQSGLRNEFEVSLDNIVRPLLKQPALEPLQRQLFARAGIEWKNEYMDEEQFLEGLKIQPSSLDLI